MKKWKVGDRCVVSYPTDSPMYGRIGTVEWACEANSCVRLDLEDGSGIINVWPIELTSAKPTNRQVGGDHYQGFAIAPIDFIQQNNLNFLEGCVVKRICRHRAKNGREDLEKIIHEVQLLIDHEYPE